MLVTGLAEFDRRVDRYTDACLLVAQRVFEAWVPILASEMVTRHRWTNRTGEAERKLRAFFRVNGRRISMIVESGAPHGVFLERGFQGRFEILLPTLRRNWARILRDVEDEWAKVRV